MSDDTAKKILLALANGDLEIIKAVQPKLYLAEGVGQMANTPFKQAEYTAVSGITLFTRAAIEGGVNAEDADNLSDLYIQKVASAKSEFEVYEILKSSLVDFCMNVQNSKARKSGPKHIEQCKGFIAKQLFKHFTLDDIANAVGINKCYLTHQFSKEEGKSLKRYIHEERIKAAQNMLKFSDQPISVIANYLCFDSQSHFGSVFKSITGITPSEYRAQNRAVDFLQNQDI